MLDREGGRPIEMSIENMDINGFIGKQDWESTKFFAPCVFNVFTDLTDQENGSASLVGAEKVKVLSCG